MQTTTDGIYIEEYGIRRLETQFSMQNNNLYTTAFVVNSPAAFSVEGIYILDPEALNDVFYYSPSTHGFYTMGVSNNIPADAVVIGDDEYGSILVEQAQGKTIVPGSDNHPTAVAQSVSPATDIAHHLVKASNTTFGHVKIGAGVNVNNGVISVDLSSVVLQFAYPVGAIYQSTVSTSPATLFGGTWEEIGAGRVLIGVGTTTDAGGHVATYTAGATGGNSKISLVRSNIPAHTHEATTVGKTLSTTYTELKITNYARKRYDPNDNGQYAVETMSWAQEGKTATIASHNHTVTVGSTGNGAAFNIEQPYLVVYRWVRTA